MTVQTIRQHVSVIGLVLGLMAGCNNPNNKPLNAYTADSADEACDSCHGSDGESAPPSAVDGSSSTDLTGVGAHRAHLGSSDWRAELVCDDCHLVPVNTDDPGHIDSPLPAELSWGRLARAAGATPGWDGSTCTNYCHGQTMAEGAANTTPRWTRVDGSQDACGSCHGLPPTGEHPPSGTAACSECHGVVINPDGSFSDPERHVDGVVDLDNNPKLDCAGACHGTRGGSSAPPADTLGNSAPSNIGVGTHQAHLASSSWHRTGACEDCHLVPTNYDDPGHMDTPLPAEMVWGALSTQGLSASWDGSSCTTYCHGAAMAAGEGTLTEPDWTAVNQGQAECGSCHALPPGGDHPASSVACATCHGEVIAADLSFVAPERHVDGIVDVYDPTDIPCNSCHGDLDSSAPPVDLSGGSDTASTSVGAHRAHLAQGTSWHADVVCEDCHLVPEALYDAGHIDTPTPAEVITEGLGSVDGAHPNWDGSSCSNYCHGQTLQPGGSNTTPLWTVVDDSQDTCGTCHGLPPGGAHPAGDQCEVCHAEVVDANGFVAPDKHVDGFVQVAPPLCTQCHGQNADPAPPRSVLGDMDTSFDGVGAHSSHLTPADWHADVSCEDCHIVPITVNDPGHVDTWLPAELTWGPKAQADGAFPNYDGASCSNYCHGQTLNSGTNTNPWWTKVDGTQAICGSCHGVPPADGHPPAANCEACHTETMGPGLSIVDGSKHIDGILQVIPLACDTCHGSGGEAAPPQDTSGNTATTVVGVGAHRSHIATGSDWHADLDCSECHVVPSTVSDAGHMDTPLPAELTWGSLASADSAAPDWDGSSCTNYCHGQTLLSGGANTTPSWTTVDGSQAACGSCHSLPPAVPHPQNTNCDQCHGMVVNADNSFNTPSAHINGVVDVIPMACDSCHGAAGNPAPPDDLAGNTATSSTGVGAHRQHLVNSGWHLDVTCEDCHLVPSAVSDPGHLDTLPADLTWSARATADLANPTWDGSSCTNYCHGQTLLPGGSNTAPVWILVDGTQAQCGSCHGLPPGGAHPAATQCELCHGAVIGAGMAFVDSDRHIDGVVDVIAMDCDSCHGGGGDPAPPQDTQGNTATIDPGVGAHQSHLTAAGWHGPVVCEDCHVVPTNVDDPGHIDNTGDPAEVPFGGLANADGASAAYDAAAGSCTSYCHGQTLSGGSNTTPDWTTVDGTQDQCGACHGLPPGGAHPASSACELCHGMVIGPGLSWVDGSLHINGTVDVIAQSCDTCHGSAATPAPPQDTSGNTNTAITGVGAHQSHISTGSSWHADIACTDCHLVPSAVSDAGHIDTPLPAELTWGGIAEADLANAAWDGTTCTNYCHGQTLLPGGSLTTPTWTKVDGTQAVCGTCHSLPPGGTHPVNAACEACHAPVAGPGQTIADPTRHVDGVVDVSGMTCTSCHGSGSDPAPPSDTQGNTATTSAGVGAHQQHLANSGWHRPVVCTDCHQVPSSVSDAGHIDSTLPAELSWGAIASADGATPNYDGASCSLYCHGQTLSGGAITTPVWTDVNGTQTQCGACHGLPPTSPTHPNATRCEVCHGMVVGPGLSFVDGSRHVDGVVDVVDITSCETCHGGGGSAAPPLDTQGNSLTSDAAVGAHRSHLGTSTWHNEIVCTDCHLVPGAVDDVGHIDTPLPAELNWSTLASADLASPAWDGTTCTNYCHGQTLLTGGSNTTPAWTTVNGSQAACGTCHGLPPGGVHPANSACEVCHGPVAGPGQTIATPSRHIDGVLDVVAVACDSCHGGGGQAAPPSDVAGNTAVTVRGVGAHQQHLTNSGWHADIACTECHVVPTAMGDAGHIDTTRPADLTWGVTATADLATPTWDGTSCTNYCHGQTLIAGGSNTSPVWTTVDNTQDACGTCHGLPPVAPHPTSSQCNLCHGMVVDASQGFVDPTLHVNGTVEVIALACDSCHGGGGDPSPPQDTSGNTATTDTGVGAHRNHLAASGWHRDVLCTDCHTVPVDVSDPGHIDTNLPAELTWGALPGADGVTPSWDGSTCTVYCHGASKSGGVITAPIWIKVDNTQDQCGACHGLPPTAATHPNVAADSCYLCHPTVGPGLTFLLPQQHIDGTVDVNPINCDSCHGAAGDPAPPVDTAGNSSTGLTTVGAHQSHVTPGSSWHADVACTECHIVPGAVDDPGHIDNLADPAELIWGPTASADLATPTWDGTGCTNYCHGQTLQPGGSNTAPAWTTVNGSQAVCGTCHSLPPGGTHTTSPYCEYCHNQDAGPNFTITNPSLHINGTVEVVAGNCDDCHGAAGDPAPPFDTQGNSATSVTGVGAHQSHLTASGWHAPIACDSCHLVPTAFTDAGHIDTPLPAELTWGGISEAGLATANWDGSSCTNYCHGQTLLPGGALTTPTWTTVDGTQAQCGTCHGLPPGGTHPSATRCEICHIDAGPGQTIANGTLHIDGVVQVVAQNCDSCHGGSTVGDPAPPQDTSGNVATSVTGVGAHQSHLGVSNWHLEVVCTDCHQVPVNVDDAGHIDSALPAELSFGWLAGADAASPSWDGASCTNYCHGQTLLPGGSNTTPDWTTVDGSQAVCGTCHGLPPGGSHPNSMQCQTCHGTVVGASLTIIDATLHIDGLVEITNYESTGGITCTSCHKQVFDRMAGTVTTTFGGKAIGTRHSIGGVIGVNDSFNQSIPNATWANPLDATPVSSRSCTNMCHNDHEHVTSTVATSHENNVWQDAVDSTSRGTFDARMSTDFDGALPSGGLCMSCHSNPVTVASELHPALDLVAYDASAHDFVGGNYNLHLGGAFARNCTKCHASSEDQTPNDSSTPFGAAHFSEYDSLLMRDPIGNNAPANLLCYQCHGTGDAVDVQSQIALPSAHPVNSDTAHDTIGETPTSWGSGAYSGASRHASCLDCHNPHEAGAALHVPGTNTIPNSSALSGVSGVAFNSGGLGVWADPGVGNLSYKAVATREYEVCFKCHTSYAWGNGTPPAAPSGGPQTDVAKEFNPNNPHGHPVVGAPSGSPWGTFVNGWSSNDNLTCSDCHASSAAGPAGTHGSAEGYILKGPYNISTGRNGTQSHLCFQCHDYWVYSQNGQDGDNTGFSENGGSKNLHRKHSKETDTAGNPVGCPACHGVIPHGWPYANAPVFTTSDPAPYTSTFMEYADRNAWGPSGNWVKKDCAAAHNNCK